MKPTKIIFVILCAIILAGCGKKQITNTLNLAESVMDEQPDSALTLLKQIDGDQISSSARVHDMLCYIRKHWIKTISTSPTTR